MDKYVVAFGGGELKGKTTLKMDAYIARLAKERAGNKRARGLFFGTASHDSMPYFNSFRKTFTGEFDIKADCALCCYGEMSVEKITDKLAICDFIYVGGGDTVFMLNKWRETGIDKLISEAYDRGVILSGLSAGAICWFERTYTDSPSVTGNDDYAFHGGLGYLSGTCCPHYELRREDFLAALKNENPSTVYALEGDSGIVFKNGELLGGLTSGGQAYSIIKDGDRFKEQPIKEITY